MSDTPDVVPERLENPLNYKILALIIGATVAFQVSVQFVDPENVDPIISVISFINPLAASIAGFVVAKRYTGAQVFGKAYFALALAYLMVFLAEVTYLIYDLFLNLDPYPSVADIFFFAFYPLAMVHLLLNIRFFKPTLSAINKAWVVAIPIGISAAWVFVAFQEMGEVNFDFYYGVAFIIISSITLSLAILGAKTFKEGLLGKAWLLLVFALLANTLGDVWYYNIEIFGDYSLEHPVNAFWYASYWIVVYALYKHRTAI